MESEDLESIVGRELDRLPGPRAPRSLLPRVMAAVAEVRRPWYARAWRVWPMGWQLASVVACRAVIAAASMSWPVVQDWGWRLLSPMTEVARGHVDALATPYASLTRAVEVVWRVVIEPVATAALVPLALMCGASLAFGAVLGRLAFRGVSQS
jgi:hypothetical protein